MRVKTWFESLSPWEGRVLFPRAVIAMALSFRKRDFHTKAWRRVVQNNVNTVADAMKERRIARHRVVHDVAT